jgi:hypothetical protein
MEKDKNINNYQAAKINRIILKIYIYIYIYEKTFYGYKV